MQSWLKSSTTVPSSTESDDDEQPQKRARSTNADGPLKIITMNANSFALRLEQNSMQVDAFFREHEPDVIAIQEARYPGMDGDRSKINLNVKGDKGRAVADNQRLESFCRRHGYTSYTSLNTTRHAGSIVAVRNGIIPTFVAYNFEEAEAKEGRRKAGVIYDPSTVEKGHYKEGRVIILGYPTYLLLATYAPNNGSKEEHFIRRRKWDQQVQLFVSNAHTDGRPVVFVGDLNVAHTPADISHPAFFLSQFVQPGNLGDSGQPGFTPNERKRFDDILREGHLVDTFRHFKPLLTYHPTNATPHHPEHVVNPEAANYTWRGCEGKNNPMSAKYYKKAMRIDYALVSRSLLNRVVSCEIMGRGYGLDGFLGSDHCPVMLTLAAVAPAAVPVVATAGEVQAPEVASTKEAAAMAADVEGVVVASSLS